MAGGRGSNRLRASWSCKTWVKNSALWRNQGAHKESVKTGLVPERKTASPI